MKISNDQITIDSFSASAGSYLYILPNGVIGTSSVASVPSGTTNFIPRYTTSTTLGTSSISDTSTRTDFYNETYFNKAAHHLAVTASTNGTYTLDMSLSNIFVLTMTGSTTLDTTNERVGSYVIILNQDSTGGRNLSLTSGKFIGATAISIATAPNAKNILQIIYGTTQSIITGQQNLINL